MSDSNSNLNTAKKSHWAKILTSLIAVECLMFAGGGWIAWHELQAAPSLIAEVSSEEASVEAEASKTETDAKKDSEKKEVKKYVYNDSIDSNLVSPFEHAFADGKLLESINAIERKQYEKQEKQN